jgi:hypothetical protein
MSFWQNLMSGGATAGGIYALMDELRNQQGNVKDTIGDLTDQVEEGAQFIPSGVTSGMGGYQQDATGGGQFSLSGDMQKMFDQMMGGASGAIQGGQQSNDYLQSLLTQQRAGQTNPEAYKGLAGMKGNAMGLANQYMGLAGQDPTQREGDIYNRLREMQRPDEQRAQESMNANLFGSGRGGMSSAAYGGSPEQHAYAKARSEAMNQASYQAMNQAQQEMMNYGNMGNQFAGLGSNLAGQQQSLASQNVSDILGITGGMGNLAGQSANAAQAYMQGGMLPYEMMNQQAQTGLSGQGMSQEMMMNRLGMLGDLGLGGLGTELNYSNIMGNLLGQAIPGLASAAGGVGGAIDDGGGLWESIKGLF